MSIRSIGCFGFENLDLVNPRNLWPNDKGLKSAKHFEKIAKKVKTFYIHSRLQYKNLILLLPQLSDLEISKFHI